MTDKKVSRRKVLQGAGAAAFAPHLGEAMPEMPTLLTPQQKLLGTLQILAPAEPINQSYPEDPVQFIRDVLGITLWAMQEEIVYSVWENRYTSVASCHAIGKSVVSAAIVVTYLHLHENSVIVSTAPTGRQVEHILWRNIRKMYRSAKKPLLGSRPPLTTRYDIAETWFAMGFKPQDGETDPLQGFHAVNILAVIDEAAGVATTIIDGMMAAMTTPMARMLMIGNPTSTAGPFYDSHHASEAMFRTFVVAWPDTPNYHNPGSWPGLIDHQWVEDIIAKYGVDSAYYRSRVMAEWVSAEDVLIPLDQIEEAIKKGIDYGYSSEVREAGLDVARDGKDKTVLTLREGSHVKGTWELKERDYFEISQKVFDLIDKNLPGCGNIKIDEIGLGAGMVDVMKRMVEDRENFEMRVTGVNFSKKPHDDEAYNNQRSEAYGLLAQRFRELDIQGHITKEVKSDLSDLRARYGGRQTQPQIESKEEFRKRTGHSPDHADSLALAFYTPPLPEPLEIGVLSFGYAEQKWGKM